MNLEELNIILIRGENTRTEFKEAKGNVPGSFYQTVAAFLNHEGGIVVLGADDDGYDTRIDFSDGEQLKRDLITADPHQ